MQDLFSIIQERRSIRAMKTTPIPQNDLNKVLEAVQWSPSWANTQCWEVVVVSDPGMKKKLQENMPSKGNPATNAILEAPVVLVMCAKKSSSGFYKGGAGTVLGDWLMFDLGLATQNLCLMAHSLGLGTVIVGMFDHRKAADVVNMPEGYELVAMIPMGYPAKEAKAPKRREVSEFSHYNKW